MLQGVVDGGDSLVVAFVVADAVALPHGVGALHAELGFKRSHELAEEVDDVPLHVFVERAHDVGFDEGREDDRTRARFDADAVDGVGRRLSLLDSVHKRHARLLVFEVGELRRDGVRERFGGDGRAVADDEDLADGMFGLFFNEFGHDG